MALLQVSITVSPLTHPSLRKATGPLVVSVHPVHTFEHNPVVNSSQMTDFNVSCLDHDGYGHAVGMSLALPCPEVKATFHSRGTGLQACYLLTHTLCPRMLVDLWFPEHAVFFFFLESFVSDDFIPDLSAWTLSFSSFKTAQLSPADFF